MSSSDVVNEAALRLLPAVLANVDPRNIAHIDMTVGEWAVKQAYDFAECLDEERKSRGY